MIEQLTELAHEQLALEQNVVSVKRQLAAIEGELRTLSEDTIPKLMDTLGVATFTTTDGITITIKETVRANITNANRAAATAWLRANGHSSIIKRTLTVLPSDDDEADELLALLGDYSIDDRPNVHAQTLSAFVREMLANGEDIPMDLLGVYSQRASKCTIKEAP